MAESIRCGRHAGGESERKEGKLDPQHVHLSLCRDRKVCDGE